MDGTGREEMMHTEPRRTSPEIDSCLVDFRGRTEKELEQCLKAVGQQIAPADPKIYEQAAFRWSKVAKPLNSLGILEEDIMRIASVQGAVIPDLEKKQIKKILEINPYETRVYCYIMKNNGGLSEELRVLLDFLGIDMQAMADTYLRSVYDMFRYGTYDDYLAWLAQQKG